MAIVFTEDFSGSGLPGWNITNSARAGYEPGSTVNDNGRMKCAVWRCANTKAVKSLGSFPLGTVIRFDYQSYADNWSESPYGIARVNGVDYNLGVPGGRGINQSGTIVFTLPESGSLELEFGVILSEQWCHMYDHGWTIIWIDNITIDVPFSLSGVVSFPDTDSTPLYNAKVTPTMYYLDSAGNIVYLKEYPPVYSAQSGIWGVEVSGNPFSVWSWDYIEFILYGGWNRVSLKVEACNGHIYCKSGIIYSNGIMVSTKLHHHFKHELVIKDSTTNAYLVGASVTYYDGFLLLETKTTDTNGRVVWTDAHPIYIAHQIVKEGYRIRAPVIDRRGIDVLWGCWQTTEVLVDKLIDTAFVRLDKTAYSPDEIIHITYDTKFRDNCRIKLYDQRNNLLRDYALLNFTNSPPEVTYAITGSVNYGKWIAKLLDSDGDEIANASANIGTAGVLGYNISKMCTDKTIDITFSSIFPVFKPGPIPHYMRIDLYDAANRIIGTYNVNPASGTWTKSLSGGEDKSGQWKAVLIDQWGYVVNTKHISVFVECNQKIFGHVKRRDGTAVEGATVTTDLRSMGYGTPTAVTNSSGAYTLTGLPPIMPFTDVVASKEGFASSVKAVDIEPDQLKTVEFILEGIIKGTVKDIEGTEINAPSVFRISGSSYIFAIYYAGTYDLECPPGTLTLKCAKKNFQDYSAILTVSASQITHNITLLRPVPDVKLIAVETAEASLDDTDSNAVFNSSGQDIVVVDQSIVETQHRYATWGRYQTVMYLSKKYFAGYTINSFVSNYQKISTLENNRLHTVLIDDSTKRSVYAGSTITLNSGYVLKVKDVDGAARSARLALLYYGDEVDDTVVSAGQTYIYHSVETALAGLPAIAAHIQDVFSGREANTIFIDGLFQISEAYIAIDGQVTTIEKYFLRSGSRDATGAYQLDSSSNIVIEK